MAVMYDIVTSEVCGQAAGIIRSFWLHEHAAKFVQYKAVVVHQRGVTP